jgi:hypothetical protein
VRDAVAADFCAGRLMVLSAYGLIQGGVWRELNAGYLD